MFVIKKMTFYIKRVFKMRNKFSDHVEPQNCMYINENLNLKFLCI